MPRIPINPNSLICPDYTLELFRDTRITLVNNNTTHDQVAVLLANIWTASNTAKQLIWQLQIEADKDAAEALHQQDHETLTLKEAEAAKEKEDLHKEERKEASRQILAHSRPSRSTSSSRHRCTVSHSLNGQR